MENNKKKSLIPKAALIKAWLIWETFPQTCYNYERMMGQVVAHMFSAIIGFLYKDDPSKRKEVMKREIEFFNVHIEFGSCILGMAVALEEQKAMGENIPGEFITNLKTSLMGPLAGIGDSFIWGTLRIIATGVGLSLANQGNILGPILFLLIFNLPAQGLRYYLMNAGYKLGSGFLAKIQQNGLMAKLTYAASVLGLMVVGGMTAENVSISFPLKFGSGNEATTLNDVFNNIMPGLMPLLFTLLVYYLLKKKNVKTTTLLLICVVIGLVGAFFGILGC